LEDKGHRIRSFLRNHFPLTNKKTKALTLGCTTIEAKRIKWRLSWMLRLRMKGTFKEFCIAVLSCLQHHFDNQENCLNEWCLAKRVEGAARTRKRHSLHLSCQTKNLEVYSKFKEYHEEFMEKTS
jgi:hypothetical protein